MTATLKANRINVGPGDPCFLVASNLVDYFMIGKKPGTPDWLEGRIVSGEFVFNGKLYLPDGGNGIIIDNFPKSLPPDGWAQRPVMEGDGYNLEDTDTGIVIFGYRVEDQVCSVVTNLYSEDGALVASSNNGEFVIHRGPALLGTAGISIA